MKSVARPTRGRPSKVTKPGTPARAARPARHHHQLSQAELQRALEHGLNHALDDGQHDHDHDHDLDHTHQHPDHDLDKSHQQQHPDNPFAPHDNDAVAAMAADEYAAAAAVAVMDADMHAATVDAQGEAEADADMDDDDDDDPDHNDYPSAASQQAIGSHVDLAAASNLLANGGGGGGGGPRTSTPSAAQHQQHSQHPQHQQHQTQDMSQALLPHQLQQQQQQQQPQAQMQASHQSVDPSLVKTTEVFAHESGYSGLNVESALAKRLAREPGHRLAQQRRPDQLLNLARRSNVEALFAHIAGEPAHVPCKNCHKGHGPWTSCIVVEGQMCGSCANCWFNASGARCSFHETRNPQLAQQQQQQQQQHPPIIPTSAVGLSATDPTYHYPTPHSLAHATIVGGAVAHPALLTSNPMLQQMVTRAMTDVRGADKATRQLILIDITAKQLALQIVEYEEMAAGQDPQQQQQQQPGGPGISRQGGMGDDTGA